MGAETGQAKGGWEHGREGAMGRWGGAVSEGGRVSGEEGW